MLSTKHRTQCTGGINCSLQIETSGCIRKKTIFLMTAVTLQFKIIIKAAQLRKEEKSFDEPTAALKKNLLKVGEVRFVPLSLIRALYEKILMTLP